MIYNLGSLNIDRVLRVPHLVRPGETIAAHSLQLFAGGKGANQSVALARAGAKVAHIGSVGADGRWLVDLLAAEGVDTRFIQIGDEASGEAVIQVDDAGENSIVLWPGVNARISPQWIDQALDHAQAGSWLLVQNETSGVAHAMRAAHRRGMRIAFNPAPLTANIREYPLELAHLVCVNEIEGAALSGESEPEGILAALHARLPDCECVLTLGSAGARYRYGDVELHAPAPRAATVDTTAAGDTFLGYFLAGRAAGTDAAKCLATACRAASLCVTRTGAMTSIPRRDEIVDPV
jgi:ribokinase